MIFQSSTAADFLLPDKSFWGRMLEQDLIEISNKYKILCPTILYAEIYEGTGVDKLLGKKPEVFYIDPWNILVKNELEGHSIFQDDSTMPINLKLVKDMNEEEKSIIEQSKKLIEAFNKSDRLLSNRTPTLTDPLASFAKSPYQNLTWKQFIEKYKKCTKGTIFEKIGSLAEDPNYNKDITRAAIEESLSQYANLFPIDTFEKAFALAHDMVKENFLRICNDIFILFFENSSLGFDRIHWDKVKDELTNNNINNLFPYTRYALQLYSSLLIYQHENQYNKKIEATDFEYLYYLYFKNIIFVSADKQHETYINETGILNSRRNGSFAYVPQKDQNPKEHDQVMSYIKNQRLH